MAATIRHVGKSQLEGKQRACAKGCSERDLFDRMHYRKKWEEGLYKHTVVDVYKAVFLSTHSRFG